MSHIFKIAKTRLKECLKQKFIYSDGLRPDELAASARTVKGTWFMENDLTKQDR